MNGMKWASLILITILILSGTALAAISYTLNSIPNPPSIYTGDSTTVSFSIANNNLLYKGMCAITVDSSPWSSEFPVSAGYSVTQSISVQAPAWGNGAGSVQHTVNSYCYSTLDSTKVYQSTSFILTYTENPGYIASQTINSAQSAINSAQSSINSAQNAINDAKNLGADASLAENKLFNAQNSMQTSQSKLASANSYLASSNYNQATNTANEAKSSADTSKTDADSAYSIVVQAKQLVQAAKDSASTAITSAKKVIDSASTSKAEAQNAINDAKNIGADVGSAQMLLDDAISKLNSANTKYNEANSYFNNMKWNDAKVSADDAKTYANDALTNAGIAKSTGIQAKMNTPTPTPKASVSIDLHGEKTDVVLGEDILLKLSAVNYISMPKMHVQVIIKPPSGMSVASSEFSKSGAGQFTSDYELDPGGVRDIEVRIKSNQVGNFNVEGIVVYYFGDEKDKAVDKTVNLPITVRNEPVQNSITNPVQKSIPGLGVIVGLIGLLFAIFLKKKRQKNK
ncbi:MAG: hypothetical protein O8C61_02250 [Candidatus Methanoperedens sp.]|nr:hypothetical protein [Candidatus Methanoperedens sp.]